jgi:hypothetical protein
MQAWIWNIYIFFLLFCCCLAYPKLLCVCVWYFLSHFRSISVDYPARVLIDLAFIFGR